MNRSCYSPNVEKKEKELLVRNRCGEMKKYGSELLWRLRSGITAQNVYF